jgi:hypothetical protein
MRLARVAGGRRVARRERKLLFEVPHW